MSTEDLASFGALLRRYRMAMHLTQKQLAARSGVSQSAIVALERGAQRPPPAAKVELLADALALSNTERAELQAAIQSFSAVPDTGAPTLSSDAERPAETRRPHIEWIPIQPTPLVGRSQEVETILRMLTVD